MGTGAALDIRAVAMEAVLYVQAKMTVGAANKVPDILGTVGMSVLCVAAERSVTKDYEGYKTEAYLRMIAATAENVGCGNCGEQSATAFVYLLDKGVRPLDWMALESPGDHAFVVLSRASGSDDHDPSTWGPAAMVCDPWKGRVYAPNLLVKMWHHKPRRLYRVEK
jgi:hypothetical protein